MEVPVFTRFYLLNDRRNKVKSEKGFSPFSFPSYFSPFFFFHSRVDLQNFKFYLKSRSRWDSIICKISVKY